MNGKNATHKEISDLKTRQAGTEKAIANLLLKFSEVDKVLVGLRVKSEQIVGLQGTVTSLEKPVSQESSKLADLDDRSRRSHIIVVGVPESPRETEADFRKTISHDLFATKLGVRCSSVARIHRLGKKEEK